MLYDGHMILVPDVTGKRPLKVVTIGGGTGHHVLLTGIKERGFDITAIVSMADDGGSTGVLRDELGVLPPGDVRQCLTALSQDPGVMRDLFTYRFSEGALKGHAFGNIFLAALEKVSGNFAAAVEYASRILTIKGRVLPVTEGDMRLIIELKDGTRLAGEKFLETDARIGTVGVRQLHLLNRVVAYPAALESIQQADVILLGPGDLYSSVIPPLLVPGISHAITSSHALVVYTANLTNKKGQTNGFTADDYAREVHHYLGAHRIDVVVCNNEEPAPHLKERYEAQEGKDMLVVAGDTVAAPYQIIQAPLVSQEYEFQHPHDALLTIRSFIRHDPKKLADVLEALFAEYIAVRENPATN